MKKLIVLFIGLLLVACVVYAATDYACMSDCIARYSWDYCLRVCSY